MSSFSKAQGLRETGSRQLKKAKKIINCWTAEGKVLVKDLTNKIMQISSTNDLALY